MSRTTTRLVRMAVVNDGSRKRGDGLKGQFFDLRLTGVDVFVGPNDSGKSTRLVLPYVVALGLATTPTDAARPYLGDLPERTSGVLELDLADGSRVEVVRDLSTGASSRANRQCALDVAQHMGIPPTRWDLRDFAAGTDTDRSRVVDAVVKAGGDAGEWTVERVVSLLPASPLLLTLRGVLAEDIAAADWLARAATWAGAEGGIFTQRNAVFDRARSHLSELEEQVGPEVDGDAAQDATQAAEIGQQIADQRAVLADVERAAAAFAAWTATEARLRNEVEQAERRMAAVALPPPAGAAEAIDRTVAGVLADLAAAEKRMTEATAATAAARALVIDAAPVDCAAEERALAEAQAALDAHQQAPVAPVSADLTQALAEATSRMEAVTARREQAQAAVHAARAELYRVQALEPDPALIDRLTAAEAAREATRRQLAGLGERLAQAQARLDVARESVSTGSVCVHCGGSDPLGHGSRVTAAEDAVAILADAIADLQDLLATRNGAVLAARQALENARAALAAEVAAAQQADRTATEAAEVAIGAAHAAQRAHMVAEGALSTAMAQAKAEAQARATARQRAVDMAATALEQARSAGQRAADHRRAEAIAQAQAAESAAADRVQALRGRLAQVRREREDTIVRAQRNRLEREAAAEALAVATRALADHMATTRPTEPGDVAEVQQRIAALRAELAPILARQQRRVERDERLRLVETARESLAVAEALLDEVKALRAGLDEVKATMAAEAFVPLERAGNLLLAGLPFALYVNGPSDFGTIEGTTKVPFWSLGGGRERVVAAAMAFAFAVVSKAPWRPVAIDDLETIRSTWRWTLLENLVRAQADGLVSNVLCTWQSEVPVTVPEGVTVHALGLTGERQAA